MRETPFLIAAGVFWTQASYLILYLSLQSVWLALPAGLDLAIAALRVRFGRHRRIESQRAPRIDDINIAATTVWIALIAAEAFLLARIPSVECVVLAAILAIGFLGYVTTRFAAFPGVALLMIGLLGCGLSFGLLTSPFPELFKLGVMAPMGSVAFGILVMHAHDALIEAIRAKHENRWLSLHDSLTGLPNRLMMRERLAELCPRWEGDPTRGSFAVLCLDLDGFKRVNDQHGHAAGDEVLVGVAKIIASEMAGDGPAFRIGGDEFVILLPSADHRGVVAVAERLIAAVAHPFSLSRGVEAQVGITVGAALCPQNGRSLDTLLSCADNALYEAKRAGKGRLSFARTGLDALAPAA